MSPRLFTPAAPKANGKHAPLPNGEPGSVVLVCVKPGLAAHMRKVILPAACEADELRQLKDFCVSRRVVVAHCGQSGRSRAIGVAREIEEHYAPELVGTIDLTAVFGFPGDPEAWVPWWEEASGNGNQFGDGVDFLRIIDREATWRRRSHLASVGLDDGDPDETPVENPVGEMASKAFHGVMGELALLTQPETEANPVFVLMHLLTFFGISAKRGPHFIVSARRHYLNLFCGLVGPSGLSRKGTAGSVAEAIWQRVDADFARHNIRDGLNSGAGLLYGLRDTTIRKGKDGKPIIDEGIEDKNRVFLEEELASVLKQGHRENDPLLEMLRSFFDGKEVVRSGTKDPTEVTGAHIGIIGHCTPSDLTTNLTDADKANGTANRLLWLFGVRSKILPGGGNVFDLLRDFLDGHIQRLREAVDFSRTVGVIRRDPKIEARWRETYLRLNDFPPGRLGALFVRSPVFVLRIASIFALADLCPMIRQEHLDAALAIWDYSARSLRFLFPDDADPKAEKLLDALRESPEGMTKTEIYRTVFSSNGNAGDLDRLLERLLAYRLIVATEAISKSGRGRKAVRYKRPQL